MPYTPSTPGKDISVEKPRIPFPAWGDEESASEGTVKFLGEYEYQDSEAGVVINNLSAKGYYIQHTRSGTYSADTSIRAFYNNTEILENILSLDETNPYSTAEMFTRHGMWVCQSTSPANNMDSDSFVQSPFSRALLKDEPYITSLILGTSGATSGTYKVWIYE